ncbi:MAG: helix-turn-helix domain-containing protein [Candidatus Aerophobetes bacterium]|nr:helix-turn-helix domain-containing protein [Candidatus Aerophobetes bacterium]
MLNKAKINTGQKKRVLLNTKELIKELQVTKATIRRYIKAGMPAYRVGLGYQFDINEVIDWLKKNKRVGRGVNRE